MLLLYYFQLLFWHHALLLYCSLKISVTFLSSFYFILFEILPFYFRAKEYYRGQIIGLYFGKQTQNPHYCLCSIKEACFATITLLVGDLSNLTLHCVDMDGSSDRIAYFLQLETFLFSGLIKLFKSQAIWLPKVSTLVQRGSLGSFVSLPSMQLTWFWP